MSKPAPSVARDHFPLLVIAGVALLGYVTAAVIRAADRGNFADALSTYRSDPRGARGLYLFAQESGLPVHRSQRDLQVLEPKAQMVLLAVDGSPDLEELLEDERDGGFHRDGGLKTVATFWPSADGGVEADAGTDLREGLSSLFVVPLHQDERKALLEHVAQGATVLYAPSRMKGDEILQELGVSAWPSRSADPVDLSPAVPSPYTAEVGTVEVPVRGFLELEPNAVPLLDDEEGAVVMALVPHGKGWVVVLTAPDLASNQWLAREDNAQLWLSTLGVMARSGPVVFDEYHHGFTGDRSVAELASRYGLHFAIGQLLLGLCLWGAALRRFGRPRQPPEDERLAGADALSAISRIYREGKHRSHAAKQILLGLLQDLAPVAGRRPHDGPQAVGASLEARGRKDLAAALHEVHVLSELATTERDLERTARAAALARRRLAGT